MGATLTPKTLKQFLGLLLTLVGFRRAVRGLYAAGIRAYVTEHFFLSTDGRPLG